VKREALTIILEHNRKSRELDNDRDNIYNTLGEGKRYPSEGLKVQGLWLSLISKLPNKGNA